MPGMPGMHGLPPLSWSSFLSTWHLAPGWLAIALLLLGGYTAARHRAGARSTVRWWRVCSFAVGCVLMWACIASGVGAYAMAVFWMHMVLHLLLIMVVPALLVLGHPITVVLEALPDDRQARARAVVRSWPATVVTHQLTGLLLYGAVIIGTHLTGFMDEMTLHPWLMTAEQVLYVVTGYLFLLPLLGEEPTHPDPAYLIRFVLLMIAMVPDTLVGIVLLQTDKDLFPVMMASHPGWAPAAVSDIHDAGGLMWVGGDGLMMAMAVGLMIGVATSPTRRDRMTGPWLDAARRSTLAARTGLTDDVDPDGDDALAAYNRMLERLGSQTRPGRPHEDQQPERHPAATSEGGSKP